MNTRTGRIATVIVCIGVLLSWTSDGRGEDSLPPLKDAAAPRTLDDLWRGYDPRAEPLETTVVREWKQEDATCRYVVFTVGTFKGKRSRLAGFYAFGSAAKGKLPGLLHLHGGGQRANLTEAVFAARNGYAALSINWGAREMEGQKPGEPNTDWGALDATQTGHNTHYRSMQPDDKTLDAVESPRNNNWFLLVLAARRALTFLERQEQVDAGRLGVCGHSMGGKLTTDLSGIDERVRVAVPSCGGAGSATSDLAGVSGSGLREAASAWHASTIDDRAYIPRIRCPILYLSPTNDFHAPLDAMAANWKAIASREVRYAVSPHFNHRHAKEFSVSQWLWLDHYLQGTAELPRTPSLEVDLSGPGGVPVARLRPDRPGEVSRVRIYYSIDPHVLTRFWREAPARREGDAWTAPCPVMSTDQPLYVQASAYYPMRRTFKGYQWLEYDGLKEFAISSTMLTRRGEELQRAKVQPSDRAERIIDDFARPWEDWYRLQWPNPVVWQAATRKVKDPKWRAGKGAVLAVDVKSPAGGALVVRASVNTWGAFGPGGPGEYAAEQTLAASSDWQTVRFRVEDFLPCDERTKGPLDGWGKLTELGLCGSADAIRAGRKVKLGGQRWPEPRQFRNLRWE